MTARRPPGWLTLWLAGAVGLLCGVVLVVAVRGVAHDHVRTVTRVVQPRVPDVVGRALPDARDALDHAGYDADVVEGGGLFGPIIDSDWVVVVQAPHAGARLRPGAKVRLSIARG